MDGQMWNDEKAGGCGKKRCANRGAVSEDNRNTYFPRRRSYQTSSAGSMNVKTDRYLQDASYIRLKNVEIGYTLPKAWTSKAGIQSVRIYAQGQNLLTFDRLGDVDMDPEIKNGDGSWFPVQRVVNLGINMTF